MRSWELIFALVLLSPLILTVLSFFVISLMESIRETMRRGRTPPRSEMLPQHLEELLRRRRR
jgi:hypothetical protein